MPWSSTRMREPLPSDNSAPRLMSVLSMAVHLMFAGGGFWKMRWSVLSVATA